MIITSEVIASRKMSIFQRFPSDCNTLYTPNQDWVGDHMAHPVVLSSVSGKVSTVLFKLISTLNEIMKIKFHYVNIMYTYSSSERKIIVFCKLWTMNILMFLVTFFCIAFFADFLHVLSLSLSGRVNVEQ